MEENQKSQTTVRGMRWLLVILLILLLALIIPRHIEGFADLDTLTSQRQQLQWEGETRYNDLARLQAPTVSLDQGAVTAAVQQVVPTPTSATSSLLDLLGISRLSAMGPGVQGATVEQTGSVQQKIDFCEAQTQVNCDQLNDPRMAECGFCHRGGKGSKGQPHRGGLYISADDQIRANAAAAGGKATYAPTIGSCPAANFTLMAESCKARELQLTCASAGGPTSANACAQCYGGVPAAAGGLLYVGPKPRAYAAILNVSHPGGHSNGGVGLSVSFANGTGVTLPPSNAALLDPKQITLTITEGDALTITIYGAPAVWCAWLSSPDGKRVVSLDVGVQSITPAAGFEIAGDKRAATVTNAMARAADPSTWSTFQAAVPNTVMWYVRRAGQPGIATTAWYGVTPNPSDGQGTDVTGFVKLAAGGNQNIQVLPAPLGIPDPAPNVVKHLWITQDTGSAVIAADGQTIDASRVYNSLQLAVTVPATLMDPPLREDAAACPSGPLVFTEVGAGLMGSHSCFKPDGSFNPTAYCLQELFRAAGGTEQGTAFPVTDAAAAALVVKDPQGNPSLDLTVAALNQQGSIALYGVDANGVSVSFAAYVAASKSMLGLTPTNPCDGPTAKTGPHSTECLDYLWRTSGDASKDGLSVDPTTLPYAFCTAQGTAAPLNPDGSVNQANVTTANGYGPVASVRSYFQSIFNKARDSSDFDAQAAAMAQCTGTILQAPPEPASACPPANPDEWQCFVPRMLQPNEVFYVAPGGGYNTKQSDAAAVCGTFGARVASYAEVVTSQGAGADWCATGWVADQANPVYPITTSTGQGCGNGSAGVMTYMPPSQQAGVNCFGVKPAPGTATVSPFNGASWNQALGVTAFTDSAVPAYREVGGQSPNGAAAVECASRDGQSCATFPSLDACQAWAKNPASDSSIGRTTAGDPAVAPLIDRFIRQRM